MKNQEEARPVAPVGSRAAWERLLEEAGRPGVTAVDLPDLLLPIVLESEES